MSVSLNLYKTSSPNNKITKTLTDEIQTTGTLKEKTPVTDINILIYSTTNLANYNYCYIAAFNRYYYIDVDIEKANLYRIHGHVDVLMSYATEILNNTAVVERQANKYNLYLNDNIFKVYNKTKVVTKVFPSGLNRNGDYILTVIGG